MELALITPADCVEYTRFLPGRFCLANIAMEHPKYKEYFKQASSEGSQVILDNGAFEKDLLGAEELTSLGVDINASIVIAPDIYGGNTHESYELSVDYLKRESYRKKMVVLQARKGQNDIDAIGVLDDAYSSGFYAVGIPRILVHNLYATSGCHDQELLRWYFLHKIEVGYPEVFKRIREKKLHIHLLGLGDAIHMIQYYWWAHSMDTAALFWQTLLGGEVTKEGYLHTVSSRPRNYFAIKQRELPENFTYHLQVNCQRVLYYAEKANELRRQITGNLY